jgi:hypothetical protein
MNSISPSLLLERIDSRFDAFDAKIDFVLERMTVGFEAVDERLDGVDNRLDKIDNRLDKVDGRLDKHDGLIGLLIIGQDNLLSETREVKQRVIHHEDSMEEVQYSLGVLTKAEEKDAEATINHELRLQSLEKINNIKAIPPAHLTDIQV